ncbi:MAG: MDR family MFS transporter, partial [Sciscionella sp.]
RRRTTMAIQVMTGPPVSAPRAGSKRKIYLAMSGVLIAMLLGMLDNMIVGTAMPRIVGELGGLAHFSWVVTGYVLASTIAAPLWGKVGDMFGHKRTFMTAIVLFLAASMLSGMSQNMGQLIGFRAIQGLGAGGLMVGALSIIGVLVPPRERGRYQGLLAAVMPVAMIGGPLLGGFITDNLSWRWAFYVNLPLGILALAVIAVTMKLPRVRTQHRVDYRGAALLSIGVTTLVLIASWGGTQYAWGSAQIIGMAVVGIAALIGFVFVERCAAEPILPLSLFRNRNFVVVSTLGFLLGFALFGATTFLPQFQQIVQGASATNSGLLLTPLMLAAMLVSLASGQVITRTGRYRFFPIAGGALMAVGMYLLSTMDASTSRTLSAIYMVVLGLGMGALMNVVNLIAQNSVSQDNLGVASSSATFFRQIGGSFGTSIFGAIFASELGNRLQRSLGAAGRALTSSQGTLAPGKLTALPNAVHQAYIDGVAHAMGSVFTVGAVMTAIAFLVALLIKEVPLRGSNDTGTTESAEQPAPQLAAV